MENEIMRKVIIIILAFIVLAGCKDKPKTVNVKHVFKCHAITVDTIYQVRKPDYLNNENLLILEGFGGAYTDIKTGCDISRDYTKIIYFNPIINHSKI